MEEKKKSNKTTEKSKKPNKIKLWPLYGLCLILFIGCGYFIQDIYYKVSYVENELNHITNNPENDYIKDQIASIKSKNMTLFGQLENKIELNDKILDELKEQFLEVKAKIQSQGGSSNEILILEIRSGLNIASWLLAYSYNIEAAIKILESLDEKAKLLTSNSSKVRQSLANDIAELRASKNIDQVGLFSKIESLKSLIPKLITQQTSVVEDTQDSEFIPHDGWRGYIDVFLYKLNKLAVFKRHDRKVAPLLSPENTEILHQNIILMLNQIQWSITYRHAEIYQSVINQSIETIKDNFALDAEINISIVNMLEELLKTNINPDIPKLESIITIDNLMSLNSRINYNNR